MASEPTRVVWGRHFRVEPEHAAPPESGRQRFGPLATQAVQSVRSALGRNGHVQPEQRVDLGEGQFLAPLEPPPQPSRRPHRRLRGFRSAVLTFFDRRLAVVVGAITLLLATSTAVFHVFHGLGWIDALYFTVTTAATVGYGDINLLNAPWGLKLYGIGFMLAATLSVALLYALAADAVIGARLLEALGVPRGRMRDHVVVIGVGSVGYRIVQQLLDFGMDVAGVEISDRSRFVPLVRRQGVPVLVADGRYSDTLRILSVAHARAIIAVTDDDLANIETALTARDLNPHARVVSRMFDPELAERAQRQFGISSCHSVSALATPAFVAAALGEGVLSTLERGRRLWLVAEARIADGSRLAGQPVESLETTPDMRVLAVRDRHGDHWRPSGPDELRAGLVVLVACSRDSWERFLPQATRTAASLAT
jgi:Trk K+ transport system NAD-binding subunit